MALRMVAAVVVDSGMEESRNNEGGEKKGGRFEYGKDKGSIMAVVQKEGGKDRGGNTNKPCQGVMSMVTGAVGKEG